MKMHKKLFGLLATAAVGLTLTSCGGGGGGGGSSDTPTSDTPTDTEDTPVVEVGAPASIANRTLETLWSDGDTDVFYFVDGSVVKNTYTNVSANGEPIVFTGTYTYSATGNSAVLTMDLAETEDIRVTLHFENGVYVGFDSASDVSSRWVDADLR